MTSETRNSSDKPQLAPSTAAFALSAAIVVLFNTALACVKDAYRPLLNVMNAVGYHNWITQGIVDLVLFFVLGAIFTKTEFATRMASNRLISFLVLAVLLAAAALFCWYALF